MISLISCTATKLKGIDYCAVYKPYKMSPESTLTRQDKINYSINELAWKRLCR